MIGFTKVISNNAWENPTYNEITDKDDTRECTQNKMHGEEVVDHPAHYNHGKYECIDIIDDLNLNFNVGSAFKYIWRCGLKDDEITELEKAVWYLQREIQNRKSKLKK